MNTLPSAFARSRTEAKVLRASEYVTTSISNLHEVDAPRLGHRAEAGIQRQERQPQPLDTCNEIRIVGYIIELYRRLPYKIR